jgi:FlaA1/EpsC-like NDP-sugar epimerase
MKTLIYRFRNRTAAFVHDLLMVLVAWFGAFWLRFNLEIIPEAFLQRALILFPFILSVHAIMFLYFGLYRGVWRFASMPDFIRILKAVLAAVGVCGVLIFVTSQMEQVLRSVFVLHALLLLILLGAPRFFYRWIKDHELYYKPGAQVLIVGAGQAGGILVRDLLQDPEGDYRPVAFVDDDMRKSGTEVRGIRVVARCDKIPEVVDRYQIDLIFIAIPSASAEAMRRIVACCEASGKPFRTLPRWQDLLSGRAILQELRAVSIEDLLGRAPVSLDWETISRELSGRTVLISGGGGSIGSELCRQVADLQPAALIIVERGEFNLYQIDMELRARFPELTLYAHLGDVCDETLTNHLLQKHRPDVIFHAAAYKHVPLLEFQVREAVRNNLFGTINLAKAADRYGCKTFVLISTDKAVKPTSMMGASKQLAEVYCQNFNRRSVTQFVIVRFGNVLDSAGSVVPLFRRQIEAGGPVTVTHQQVSRYFMTIPEASQLIMQAGAVGEGGEIYVLDMGEPINIHYLAEQMILLSGKVPGRDIAIQFTGLRPGEKLCEELFHEGEDLMPTSYPKLLLAQHRQGVDWPRFFKALDALRRACERYDEERIRILMQELVLELQDRSSPEAIPLKTAHG